MGKALAFVEQLVYTRHGYLSYSALGEVSFQIKKGMRSLSCQLWQGLEVEVTQRGHL
jgi:hypothetical protein